LPKSLSKISSVWPPKCKLCDKTFTAVSTLYLKSASFKGCQASYSNLRENVSRCIQDSFLDKFTSVSFDLSPHKGKKFQMHPVRFIICKSEKLGMTSTLFNDLSIASFTSYIQDLHVRVVHLKERPHQCPQCASRFAQKNHLKHHIKVIHERLKASECELCDKKYASKPDLVNHLRKIHGVDVSYPCPHCTSKFLKKKELMDHLETVHVGDFDRGDAVSNQ